MKTTGAQAVVNCLEQEGVEYIFGMIGHGNLAFFDALNDSDIRLIPMPHEQLAAHAADAYFRISHKPGVVAASIGPGFANTVNGVLADQIIRVVEDELVFAYDCNRNCINDLTDIDNGSSHDINCNDIPDECEGHVDPCICLGDVNGDLQVDVTDILAVVGTWGQSGGPADVNGDGVVDVTDLLAVVNSWGACP